MSLGDNVAYLTLPATTASGLASPTVTLPFSVARTDNGAVLDRMIVELEELTTPGVDGRRWRQVRNFFPEFRMETWADASDHRTGVGFRRWYHLAQGQFVTLYWTAGTYQGQYMQVKVLDVKADLMSGVLCGFGADPNSGVLIHARWTLCLQAIENTNPT